MSEYSKASEERIKMISSALANTGVGAFLGGVLTPLAAYALTPDLNSSVLAAIGSFMLLSLMMCTALMYGAFVYLEKLDEGE